MPHYPLPLAPNADGPIAQTFDIGRVRFLMTDARSERLPPASVAARRPADRVAARRTRPRAQPTTVPLLVWVNPVPWITPDGDDDGWGRYADERREIGERITTLGLGSRLLMLSGDAHMLAFDDGRNNQHGGFVVAQAAPLDRFVRRKGGPYSHEPRQQKNGQFGTLQVDDTGTTLTATLQGHRYLGDSRATPVPETRLVDARARAASRARRTPRAGEPSARAAASSAGRGLAARRPGGDESTRAPSRCTRGQSTSS